MIARYAGAQLRRNVTIACASVVGVFSVALSLVYPAAAAATTANAATVAVPPDGSRVYAGAFGSAFSVFSRDSSTGELTVLGKAPGDLPGGPLFQPAIAVGPNNTDVYGVVSERNELVRYTSASGGLVQQQSYPVLADPTIAKAPTTVVASPDGSNIYVLTAGVQYGTGIGVTGDGKINAFHRDPTTGDLSFVETTELGSGNSQGEAGRVSVVSPDGKFVYVAATFGVAVLSRDTSTGAVTFVGDDGGNVASAGVNGGIAIAIPPDGNFVYEAGPPSYDSSASSAISVLARDAATGRLTATSRIESGAGGVSGLSDIWGVTVSPDGQCLYATSRSEGSLGYFTRDANTGALTFGGVLTEGSGGVTGLADARAVSVSPDGNDVYVASAGDNGVGVFTRDSTTCAPTFVELAQDVFTLGDPLSDPASGTATLPVTTDTSGTLALSVQPIDGQSTTRATVRSASTPRATVRSASTMTVQKGLHRLRVTLSQQQQQELVARQKLTVRATVTFTATNGTPVRKTVLIHLVLRRPVTVSVPKSVRKGRMFAVKVAGYVPAKRHLSVYLDHLKCKASDFKERKQNGVYRSGYSYFEQGGVKVTGIALDITKAGAFRKSAIGHAGTSKGPRYVCAYLSTPSKQTAGYATSSYGVTR